MSALLTGIGLGPGDPDLITLKGYKALQQAAVIAYPAPETGDSLARRIAEPHLPGGQQEIAIRMDIGDGRFPKDGVYDAAAEEIGQHLEAGRRVAVLCEGDPLFYGSFLYLYARMAEQFEVEVIPGVTSVVACAARLGFPIAARNDVLAVIPGPLPAEVIAARLEGAEAAVIIKLGRHFDKVRRVLAEMGLIENARLIVRATMEEEQVLPVVEADPEEVPYFSTILVHRRGAAWK